MEQLYIKNERSLIDRFLVMLIEALEYEVMRTMKNFKMEGSRNVRM